MKQPISEFIDEVLDNLMGKGEPPDLISVTTATEAQANAQFKARWRQLRQEARQALLKRFEEEVTAARVDELQISLENIPMLIGELTEYKHRRLAALHHKDTKQEEDSNG